MIVVAIIGILAAAAVPNFINYRNKSRVAAALSGGGTIRASMASFAADSIGNGFPSAAAISDLATLTAVANANGSSFGASPGFSFGGYTVTLSAAPDSQPQSYTLTIVVTGVPDTQVGSMLMITDQGVFKCVQSTGSCL